MPCVPAMGRSAARCHCRHVTARCGRGCRRSGWSFWGRSQVKQGEPEVLYARDRVGQTSGATQRDLKPGCSERIGNSRRTGSSNSTAPTTACSPRRDAASRSRAGASRSSTGPDSAASAAPPRRPRACAPRAVGRGGAGSRSEDLLALLAQLALRPHVSGRCCMNTPWGRGRASWAGCGPDVKRDGHPEIDADHGVFGR